jgi:hypothetical protein
MAFEPEQPRAPVAIGELKVILTLPDLVSGESPSADYILHVKYNDGWVRVREGELTTNIVTAAQRNALLQFMQDLKTQAEQQILG